MGWTQSKPLAAGKYWYTPGGHHQPATQPADLKIVAIRPDDNGNLVALFHGVDGSTPIETLNGAWFGPLAPPA
ncbi:MAG: hypothetical protein PHP95_12290 [Desulfuromonadaceae bacterium]|nr:hypothetical protein [Desulfuromonadaceae bacterium]MDD2849223.1 hypothetical protein [Desulfuromonadaceae bacterium]MDD4129728.1 hypothetical protein [Desulfuromonadaceae bacterium]